KGWLCVPSPFAGEGQDGGRLERLRTPPILTFPPKGGEGTLARVVIAQIDCAFVGCAAGDGGTFPQRVDELGADTVGSRVDRGAPSTEVDVARAGVGEERVVVDVLLAADAGGAVDRALVLEARLEGEIEVAVVALE